MSRQGGCNERWVLERWVVTGRKWWQEESRLFVTCRKPDFRRVATGPKWSQHRRDPVLDGSRSWDTTSRSVHLCGFFMVNLLKCKGKQLIEKRRKILPQCAWVPTVHRSPWYTAPHCRLQHRIEPEGLGSSGQGTQPSQCSYPPGHIHQPSENIIFKGSSAKGASLFHYHIAKNCTGI